MNTIGRKWLCGLLALVMALTLLPGAALIADAAPSQKHFKVLLWVPDPQLSSGSQKTYIDIIKYHYAHMDALNASAEVVMKTSGPLNQSELDGVQMVFVIDFMVGETAPEGRNVLNAAPLLTDFAKRGGRVILNGEHNGCAAPGNKLLSKLAEAMGGNFQIQDRTDMGTDFEFNTAEASSLIKDMDPSCIMSRAVNHITTTGNAKWVIRTKGGGSNFIVEQQVENGFITAIADINWLSNSTTRNDYQDYSLPEHRNVRQFLYNLVSDSAQHMNEIAGSYSVWLEPNGGTIAAGKNVSIYVPGTVTPLPTGTGDVTKSGYTFGGWYDNENLDGDAVTEIGAEATGDKVYYAKWVRDIVVDVESKYPVTLDLALMRGSKVFQRKEDVAVTGTNKPYSATHTFTDVPDGIYNVVARQTDGDGKKHIMTVLVVLTSEFDATNPVQITMPSGDTNSVLTVGESARAVVAGNLEKEAAGRAETGASVTIEMIVREADETMLSSLPPKTQIAISEIKTAAQSEKPADKDLSVEFMDVDVWKTVKDTSSEATTRVEETQEVIELIIPYKMGTQGIRMWRYHDNSVETLQKADSRAEALGRDGWFYLDSENDQICLYAQKFSTYAIGSLTEVVQAPEPEPAPAPAPVVYFPVLTIPVSGDENTVRVNADAIGNAVSMQRPASWQLEQIIGEKVRTGTVTIDASEVRESIVEAIVPIETIRTIEKAVADPLNDAARLEVMLPAGSVTLDAAALAYVAARAAGSDLRFHLDRVDAGQLNAAQRRAIEELDVETVYDAYLTSNGARISDLGGGTATVTVSCELNGRDASVWFVPDDGGKTAVPTTCGSKTVSWSVEHFSNYAIAYNKQIPADAPESDCPRDAACPISAYQDARTGAWYHDGVHYVLENGIMQGMGRGNFAPRGSVTRAQMATILWNMEGKPAVTDATYFKDVKPGHWYTDVVRWAASEGIMDGYGNGSFGPNDILTREQLVTILYRYAQKKGVDVSRSVSLNAYQDGSALRAWAAPAFEWAVASGAVNGKTATTLAPRDSATRAEIATIMMRYCTQIVK